MANEDHSRILRQGPKVWNAWRYNHPKIQPDLSGADFSRSELGGCGWLEGKGVGALGADYHEAVRLRLASRSGADLTAANLGGANLSEATLTKVTLSEADLSGTNMSGAILNETVFSNVDLSNVVGLDRCQHSGPSCVDHRTIAKSKDVPLSFWRGCGLPDALIDYLPSLTSQAIQFYSCFISYSSRDQEFAQRLHADLQDAGVRCWFALHDLPIGKKILDSLDVAVRLRDKVLIVLSEAAITSDWVEDEVTIAFEEERRRKEEMLLPVRLDDAVIETNEPWANKLRARNIGDFTKWKEHDAYKVTFERVLNDLKADR